jgi:mono/diheme cytochrome c family protein
VRENSTVLAIAFTLLCALGAASAQELFTPTQDPLAGARLFQMKGCVQCHAIDGVGGKTGPDLGRIEPPRSFYDLAAAMWNHLPRMAQRMWPSLADRPYLTPNEMSDLIAFLHTPGSSGAPEHLERSPRLGPADPQRGRQLVADKGCLGCHSLTGPGGQAAGSLDWLKGLDSPWTIIATMWNHSFLMALKTEERKSAWPTLSSDEMADLVAFLRAHAYSGDRGR